MNRLTPIKCGREIINCKESYTQEKIQKMFLKLGQLEDIEESYGIDLLTLLNAKTVFWKVHVDISGYKYTEIRKSCECYIDLCFHEIVAYQYPEDKYDSSGYRLAFEDYGKTWALTREELENDN